MLLNYVVLSCKKMLNYDGLVINRILQEIKKFSF